MYWKAITAGNWTTTSSWATSSGAVGTWGTASAYPGANPAVPSDDYVYMNGLSMALNTSSINLAFLSNAILTGLPISSSIGGRITFSPSTTYVITASDGIIHANTAVANSQLIDLQANASVNLTISTSLFDYSAQTNANAYGINMNGATQILTFVGNIKGGGSSTSAAIRCAGVAGQNITIIGNLSGSTGPALQADNFGYILKITGSIIAQGTSTAVTLGNAVTSFSISGSIIGGAGIGLSTSVPTTPIIINGNVTAGSGATGISSTSTAVVIVYGTLTNNGIYQAVSAQRLAISSPKITLRTTDGNDTDFTPQVGGSPNYPAVTDVRNTATVNGVPGQVVIPSVNDVRFGVSVNTGSATGLMVVPSASDVRFGVLVNTGSATGTMYVPLASQVKYGVSVNTGSTTGSYVGPADIWSYATASLTTGVGKLIKDNLDVNVGSVSSSIMSELNKSGSSYAVVTRLQNTATVGTTGDQISSFNT